MIKLWAHECLRVFHDRLISDTDREQFTTMLKGKIKEKLYKGPWLCKRNSVEHQLTFQPKPTLTFSPPLHHFQQTLLIIFLMRQAAESSIKKISINLSNKNGLLFPFCQRV